MDAHSAVAGGRLARERLEAYQRYSDLVTEQETALERGDLQAFEASSLAALELQAALGMAATVRDVTADPEAASPAFLERTMDILRATMRRKERIQTRLHVLRTTPYMKDSVEAEPRFDQRF